MLAAALDDSFNRLGKSVSVSTCGRPESTWGYIRTRVSSDVLILDIGYSPLLARSENVEQWANDWMKMFEMLDKLTRFSPTDDIAISYEDSFVDLATES